MAQYTIYPGKTVDFRSKKGTLYKVSNEKGKIVCYCNGQKRPPTKEILSRFAVAGGTYTAYTDGGCSYNPGGSGGYGVVIVDSEGNITQLSQGYKHTTNNRMEVIAAIVALNQIPRGSKIQLHSDSQYLISTITGRYSKSKNLDLWQQLSQAMKGKYITWNWVKGHAGHELNEICDQLATNAMYGNDLIEDVGYTGKQKIDIKKCLYINADDTRPAIGEVTKSCKKAIKAFYKKENPAFKDFVKLKTGGIDKYSTMGRDELLEICHADIATIKKYIQDYKGIMSVLRWNCRGLSLKDSIQKVITDKEISNNKKEEL